MILLAGKIMEAAPIGLSGVWQRRHDSSLSLIAISWTLEVWPGLNGLFQTTCFDLGSLSGWVPWRWQLPQATKACRLMGNLLVMVREMALAAVAVNVLAVAGLRCLRMAGNASDLCVRRLLVLRGVDKRDLFPGQGLRRRPELGVTMEADALNLFGCLAFLRLNPAGGRPCTPRPLPKREGVLSFPRGRRRTAHAAAWPGSKATFSLIGACSWGSWQAKTHLVFFRVLDLLRTVFSFLETGHDLFMANQAVVRLKKSLAPFPISCGLG